ncbi:hypothetical protein EXIGLDRAFT_767788 [Exidia glandulosa HHB12029]|uniref:Endonuclease/exonuclease/phosphatase domain-containing protein n=1 Tax=Exidia glandulosa HHB12029 TaxID=1314781 RepID=A0A165IP93_EXIGL|nr:hypothetical protein EXIGLDRAFT_767788 [Exidia glandulosa HHB12029]
MTSSPLTLRSLTLNCWGLKYVAKVREDRLRAIGDALADMTAAAAQDGKTPYSFIALQECWVYSDFEYIRERLRQNGTLKHSKYFWTGALGAGLAIFSAYPIRESHTYAYSLNGSPLDVAGGDWYVGKGVGSIVVRPDFLNGQEIEVFTTHFHAKGGDDGPEVSRAHRLGHAWELANIIRASAERGRWTIAMGDYNSLPRSLVMRVLREHACLADSWESARAFYLDHPNLGPRSPDAAPSSPPALDAFEGGDMELATPALRRATREDEGPPASAEDALHSRGVTADSPLNTWSAGKWLSDLAKHDKGKRLDYVLYRAPRGQLRCVQASVVFTEHVPGRDYSYSDHFGVDATLVVDPPQEPREEEAGVFDSVGTMSEDTFESVLEAMRAAGPPARKRSQQLLAYFTVAIPLLVVLIVSPFWAPRTDSVIAERGLAFGAIFLTALVTWSGTTALYAGFIFGNWEARALRRAVEELECWRDRISGP